MFRKVMGWIAGKGDDASTPPDALLPAKGPDGDGPQGEASEAFETGAGSGGPAEVGRVDNARSDGARSPVFSSRAVRDAAVVTSTIEAFRRYVAGDEQAEGLTHKLQSLSAEQFGFLQISIDPALAAKAVARAAEARTASATVLRRLLADVSDGGKPPTEARTVAAPAASAPPPGVEAEITVAPPPVAPPVPAAAAMPAAPLSVPVPPAGGAPHPGHVAPGPRPSRSGPLFTNLLSKGREAPARDGSGAEMRAVPTPTLRVPGAMSLRAAPPTPVRSATIGGTLPAQPLSTPSRPASATVTVPGGARMAVAPATAARVTLHSFSTGPDNAATRAGTAAPIPAPSPAVPAPVADVGGAAGPSLAIPVVVVTPPQASSDAPVPPPQPPAARPTASAVPRLSREQAAARRARLLETISGDL
ncbi:hypothetical protein [Nitrospirillum iridis]|uniref:Uncharacterized protein n=1 Tax=Nitrospirillum iridis TaxID=765888 RepID=A0A7X0EEY2_9PROT|nr:hypothetical protein [Nitrospirillum iridis]MBB6252511.1 hypothetical protein [Nitrospirillum iridis]